MENLWQYTDGYKLSHHIQYPQDTKVVYSNFTPRNFKHANGVEKFVVYGIKNLITRLHIKWQIFIESDWDDIEDEMRDFLKSYAPSPHNELLIQRWKQLHGEQKLPLKIMALDEMTEVGPGVPILTIHNTKPEYFWLVNYLETYISAELWKPATCASIANQYRKVFDKFAEETCENNLHVDYQGHDFSMRGMSGVDDSMRCGRAHLKYFKGTDSLLAVSNNAVSVPATEHSVMCANIFYNMHKDPELSQSEAETQFIRKLITETYPSGIVSIVSDTMDFWDTITNKAKALKKDILQRDGVTVYRPDCYSSDTKILTPEGWKYFKDLNDHDLVAQVYDDGYYEFVKPNKIIKQKYKGLMYHIKDCHGKIDLLVTPNHRLVVKHRTKGDIIVNAEDFKPGNWDHKKYRSASAKSSLEKLSNFERFLIALQADGSIKYKGKENVRVEFNFSKKRKSKRLLDILNKISSLGVKYSQSVLNNGQDVFYINIPLDFEVSKYFDWVDTSNLTKEWCEDFIEELSHWDACIRNDGRVKYDSTVEDNIKIVELIAIGAGYGITISHYEDNRKDHFNDVYTAHIMKNNMFGGQGLSKEEVQYDDYVYCVNVDTGKLLVKRNRGVCVSGNSGDPVDVICGDYVCVDADEYCYGSSDLDIKIVANNIITYLYGENLDYRSNLYVKFNNELYLIDFDAFTFDDGSFGLCQINKAEKVNEVSAEHKGALQCLWDEFGGSINSKGYKVLNPKVGLIYGDSITLQRQKQILEKMKQKGFASSNIVLGIGSYTYQCITRDTFGCAIKATGILVGDELTEIPLYKAPKGDASKHSAKGFMKVVGIDGAPSLVDNISFAESQNAEDNMLKEIEWDYYYYV